MTGDDLVGTWSNDALYGPGAQSDWSLFVRPDGMAAHAYETAASAEVTVLTWSVRDGRLTTADLGTWLSSDAEVTVFEREDGDATELVFADAPVVIVPEETPVEGVLDVLRLPVPEGAVSPGAFARTARPVPAGIDALLDRLRP